MALPTRVVDVQNQCPDCGQLEKFLTIFGTRNTNDRYKPHKNDPVIDYLLELTVGTRAVPFKSNQADVTMPDLLATFYHFRTSLLLPPSYDIVL